MGATAVFEMAAAVPPVARSIANFLASKPFGLEPPLEDEALYPDESDLLFQMKNTQNPDHIVIISKKILE